MLGVVSASSWKITSGEAVSFDDRYRIDLGVPLSDLDSPNAQAFAATDRDAAGAAIFALVCRADIPQRHHAARMVGDKKPKNTLELRASRHVPIGKEIRPVMILERPTGGRLSESLTGRAGLAEPIVTDRILPRLIEALAEFEHQGIAHRRIRLENLFYRDQAKQQIVLGECFTEPPGYSQPVYYETLERGMADPIGRGEGGAGTDLYALGVAIMLLLLGRNPVEKLSAEELFEQKMSHGSYVTLSGGQKFSGPTERLLRGLLCDDSGERWGMEDAEGWVWGSARRLQHKPTGIRARSPIRINGKDILYDRMAALEIGRLGESGAEIAGGDKLANWVRGGLDDSRRHSAVIAAREEAGSGAGTASGILVSRVCAVLDPGGPVRYRGLSICRDGFGAAVAAALSSGDIGLQQKLSDLFASNYLSGWEAWDDREGQDSDRGANFGAIRSYVENSAPGFGLERCLYELNTATPCLSPPIAAAGALELGDLLQAIEDALENPKDDFEILDRHIAAFVASRSTDAVKAIPQLAVEGGDPAERRLKVLGLFAIIQHVTKTGSLPNFCKWMAARMPPVIDLYHSRSRRRELTEAVELAVVNGDLVDMHNSVGAPRIMQQDRAERLAAANEYADLEEQLDALDNGGPVMTVEARTTGYRMVTLMGAIAVVLSVWFTSALGLP